MSDNENSPPKIVSLATRTAYEPKPEIAPATAGEPDPDVIDQLEELLNQAKAGHIHGIAALSWSKSTSKFGRHITIPYLDGAPKEFCASAMIGGLQMLHDDLRDVAFWSCNYDPLICSMEPTEPELA